jgi:hypothetical protein
VLVDVVLFMMALEIKLITAMCVEEGNFPNS